MPSVPPPGASAAVAVAFEAGGVQRCGTAVVWLVNRGLGGEQQLHTVSTALLAGSAQGRSAVFLWLVDGGVGGETVRCPSAPGGTLVDLTPKYLTLVATTPGCARAIPP